MDNMYTITALVFLLIIFFFTSYDWRKYKKNVPYETKGKKNNISKKIATGILAGFHYLHFIGTYNHKKYNTQVYYPVTLECDIGVAFAAVLLILYLALANYLKLTLGNIGLSILLIPIITNIISIVISKKR